MQAFDTIKKYALTLIQHYTVSQGIYNTYGKNRAAELTAEIDKIVIPPTSDSTQENINITAGFARLSTDLANFCKTGQTEKDMKSSSMMFSITRTSHTWPTSLRGMFLSFFTKPAEASKPPVQTYTVTDIQKNIVECMNEMNVKNADEMRSGSGILDRKIQLIEQINNWIVKQASYLGRSHGVKRAMELVRKINQAPTQSALDEVTLDFLQTGKTEVDNYSLYKPSGTAVTSLRGMLIFLLLGKDVDKQKDFLLTLAAKTSQPGTLARKLGFPVTETLDNKPVDEAQQQSTRLSSTV